MNLFTHRMMGHYLQSEAPADGGQGGGAPAAPAPSAPAGSLLNQGAGNDFIPEKFRVNGADGALDIAQSSRKMAEAYGSLEKRFGSGDVPPESADGYAPKLEVEGFDFAEFKADPQGAAFLKGAHAKGLSNDQVQYVLGEYLKAVPQLVEGAVQLDQQGAAEALRGEWKNDAEFKAGLGSSYRAVQGFAAESQGLGSMDKLMAKFGNDPDFIAFTARIGREMSEDQPGAGSVLPEADLDSLMKSEAYWNEKHPDYARVQQQVAAHYARKYGSAIT